MFCRHLLFLFVIIILWMCDTMNDALIFMGKIPQNNAKNKLICENVIAWAISMAVLLPFAHRF